jgi:hypothetical protein
VVFPDPRFGACGSNQLFLAVLHTVPLPGRRSRQASLFWLEGVAADAVSGVFDSGDVEALAGSFVPLPPWSWIVWTGVQAAVLVEIGVMG